MDTSASAADSSVPAPSPYIRFLSEKDLVSAQVLTNSSLCAFYALRHCNKVKSDLDRLINIVERQQQNILVALQTRNLTRDEHSKFGVIDARVRKTQKDLYDLFAKLQDIITYSEITDEVAHFAVYGTNRDGSAIKP